MLTPAEWRVAHAVRHGMGNAEMARRLGMSPDGIKFHLRNILGKLALPDRAALRHWIGAPRDRSASRIEETAMSAFTLGPIGQISRSVGDIAAAEAFWRDVVGVPHLFTFGKLAFFDCGGTRLMLSAESGPGGGEPSLFPRGGHCGGACRDAGAGGQFIGAPHMIHRHADGTEEWMAFFNDNEGRPLAIMSQKRPG